MVFWPFLLIKITGVDREVIEKWLYVIVGLTFISGILGTGHHYYYIGVGKIWLIVGGIFSALEPLAFLAMALFAISMYRKGEKKHPNKIALSWTLGTAIVSFVGAGLLGLGTYLTSSEYVYSRHFGHCNARSLGILGCIWHDSFCFYKLFNAQFNRS